MDQPEHNGITLDAIRKAQVKNLLRKLQEGKALSKFEQEQVDSYFGAPQPVPAPAPDPAGKPLFTATREELAKLWGCSPQNVSKVRAKNGGEFPPWTSPEECLAWFRGNRQRRPSEKALQAMQPAGPLPPLPPPPSTAPTDFEGDMIRQSEEVPYLAHTLYRQAVAAGQDSLVSIRIKNWAEATKQAAAVRQEFQALQEKRRELIPMDEVRNVMGTALGAIRSALLKMGDRHGRKINPDDPARGKAALDEVGDSILATISNSLVQAWHLLDRPAVADPPAAREPTPEAESPQGELPLA